MPKVTLKTLRDDVLKAAVLVALESVENADGVFPAEGTSFVVTAADRCLWRAALRLHEWMKRAEGRKRP